MSNLSAVHKPAQAHPVRAPRGTAITCKNWLIEAAYRMLQNNLDPEVAENPDALVVYGGTGRAARSWAAYSSPNWRSPTGPPATTRSRWRRRPGRRPGR